VVVVVPVAPGSAGGGAGSAGSVGGAGVGAVGGGGLVVPLPGGGGPGDPDEGAGAVWVGVPEPLACGGEEEVSSGGTAGTPASRLASVPDAASPDVSSVRSRVVPLERSPEPEEPSDPEAVSPSSGDEWRRPEPRWSSPRSSGRDDDPWSRPAPGADGPGVTGTPAAGAVARGVP
jgi:hypothetical protein